MTPSDVTTRPEDLPEFEHPPLIEVALSVQFESVPELQAPHIGLLWSRFRDDFPQIEIHPPLPSTIERFGRQRPTSFTIQLEVAGGATLSRYWFLNSDGTELIQIQHDRFAHNWRKAGPGSEYPRFEAIRARFEKELLDFAAFLTEEELGSLAPTQCELTYVNHIGAGSGWQTHADVGKVFSFWSARTPDGLNAPEAVHVSLHYLLKKDKESIGRLHVTLDSAFDADDDSPVFVFNLVSRGSPLSDGLTGVLDFLDLGRDRIVRAFTTLTSTKMHKTWGRTR